jgi:uncharacterized membrane protein YfcA
LSAVARRAKAEAIHVATRGEVNCFVASLLAMTDGGPQAFGLAEGYLRNLQIVLVMPIGQCRRMFDSLLLLVTAAFLLAGFVKGALGLGLPTVSMGLLAVTMPPAQAIAIVIVPAIVTNIWQTFGGPYLRDIFRRLAINAIIGLCKFDFSIAPRNEKWVGGIVGLITGMISAATGVQVIPSVPFLQAIGMEKEELIQALGVFFTVATLALGLNLTGAGLLTAATALPGAVAMAASFAGMFIGQAVRTRLQPDIFRRWFQIGMIVLGLYLSSNALAKLVS